MLALFFFLGIFLGMGVVESRKINDRVQKTIDEARKTNDWSQKILDETNKEIRSIIESRREHETYRWNSFLEEPYDGLEKSKVAKIQKECKECRNKIMRLKEEKVQQLPVNERTLETGLALDDKELDGLRDCCIGAQEKIARLYREEESNERL